MRDTGPLIAAAYIRVSTDDQTEFSPDAQLKALRRYASQNGMILDERYVFSDEGISGRKAENRPGFMSMIAQAKSKEHPFDVILVHKFDRFARSREDSVVYKSMLKRALHYIDKNYTDENLSLNAVAKAANISPNYFSGVFSQEMGQTFVEYLTEKRMARAKELLRYSGKRSSEVAYEVGYRDPRYFSFVFKKTQGCTPSAYRAMQEEQRR